MEMNWKLKGGHKQKTRSGYNFWKPFTSQTKDGVTLTVKDDGSYVLSGTATQTTSFYVNGLNYDAADYTIALFNSTAISNEGFYVQVEHENGLLKQAFLTTNTIKSGTTGKVNALSIVIPADLTLNNFTFKPMLLKGIYTANTMLRFEQYGMMPSTNYPSEIETVGSNVQLFDKDNVNKLNGVPDVSSITSNTVAKSFYVQAKPNTTYTVSRKIIGSRFVVGTTANLPAVGETIIDRKVNNEGSSITLTTSKNVNYLVVYYLYNSSENEEEILDNIKIEKGSVATPYSSCGMGSAEVDVVNKTLLNIANTEETTKGGITYSIKNGILKLNGTATASFDIQLSKNIKRKKGKYTHSSSYIQSGLYISFDNLGYTMISSTVGNKKTFEITKDTTYKTYFIWIDKGTVLSNVEIKLQLEVGDTATDFVEHQSQTAIMPVQQEMLQGDYIEDVEHHEWGKLVLKGDEGWEIASTNPHQDKTTYFQTRRFDNLLKTEEIISNYFTKKKLWEEDVEGTVCAPSSAYSLRMRVNKTIASTSSKLNAYLKARYDANDPIVIYYKLANAIDLELTEAQKAVREQKLHTYKNITNINLSDELASIDVTYKKDLDTILNNLQAQIIANASEEVTE
jgi:hypothetical protein